MEQHSCKQSTSAEPKLCGQGCGFFGNPATLGLCSKCYQEAQLKTGQEPAAAAVVSPPAQPAPTAEQQQQPEPVPEKSQEPAATAAAAPEAEPSLEAGPSPAAAAAAAADEQPDKPAQANRGRCLSCNKKVGLLGFECRCGYVFCSGHRHAQDHACTFDYATYDRERLSKDLHKIAGSKLDKL